MAKNIFYQQIRFDIYCFEWVYRANFRALRVKLRELGCFKKWQKIFFINGYVLISTAVSESIEQISELYGLN